MTTDQVIRGKYRLIREISRGGMGVVWEVMDEKIGQTRALKLLTVDLAGDPTMEQRFRKEAQIMFGLHHRNIVRVFDYDEEPGFGTYLVMEFIRAKDLRTILNPERGLWRQLPYAEAIRIGHAIADALATAHAARLIHRDIKPANILIEDGTQRPVLIDFGIAKPMDATDGLTGTGDVLATLRYGSPEQLNPTKGVRLDGRSDIYSLGAVLYEMVAGRQFLEEVPNQQITQCVCFQPNWKPTLVFPRDVPDSYKVLVATCLARNRDERIATAADVVQRLDACLDEGDGDGTIPNGGRPVRRRTALWAGTGAVAVVAVVATTAIYLTQREPGAAPSPTKAPAAATAPAPHVNAPPAITRTVPLAGTKIEMHSGEPLAIRVEASDPDNDPLTYAWKLGGKPVGTSAPELTLPDGASGTVSVEVSDGKSNTQALNWDIVAAKVQPAFKVDYKPRELKTLVFHKTQEFVVVPAPGVAPGELTVSWTVDGQKVSDERGFVLKADDPQLVRSQAVKVGVVVRDAQGHSTSREWQFAVTPPPPQIVSSAPPDATLAAESGHALALRLQANPPVGTQTFTYVYEVDGKEAGRSADPGFQFTPNSDGDHRIVGYIQDNFNQASAKTSWQLQTAGIENKVREWLTAYQDAWNQQDAKRIAQMRGWDSKRVGMLEQQFSTQKNLRIAVRDLKIEKLDGKHAKVSYTRVDDWVDPQGGPMSMPKSVEQVFTETASGLTVSDSK